MPKVTSLDATYLRFLVEAGEILGASLDYHETLRNVCNAAVETVADICILNLVAESGETMLVAAAHREPSQTPALQTAGRFLHPEDARVKHAAIRVIESGKAVCVPEVNEPYIAANATSEEHAAFMRAMQYRSMIIVPVISSVKGVLGSLTLVRTPQSKARYDDNAMLFAEDLGRRCGIAISKAILFSETMTAATRMQLAALPRALPPGDGATFDAYYEPAQTQFLVGGDWYDAFVLPDGRYGISIGDISGHGIEAAALMVGLRDAIRALFYANLDLNDILTIADRLVEAEFPAGKYATAVIALYDPREHQLECAAAGHPGPLVWRGSEQNAADPFPERGLPLGLRKMCPPANDHQRVRFAPGSLAVFFTDGLTEWQRDYLKGEADIMAALERREVRESAHPARAIRDAVVRGEHPDDIALLTLTLVR
ncbi:MAG: SpoIIE family protein phosphatase [Candidatus Baltobacteraceae bacterium]